MLFNHGQTISTCCLWFLWIKEKKSYYVWCCKTGILSLTLLPWYQEQTTFAASGCARAARLLQLAYAPPCAPHHSNGFPNVSTSKPITPTATLRKPNTTRTRSITPTSLRSDITVHVTPETFLCLRVPCTWIKEEILTDMFIAPNPKQYKNCHSHVRTQNTDYSPLDIWHCS